ncbi:transposase [Nostoc sp. PCC 7524]|uniref:IS110 family transposase n=1 Tax=Nostoc sp. (strain ATCC 29411 / PCC 7524) TaxID=28072 RepID=UPI00029ED0D3|nr:IS110 family transposase [Nostoc sp. PCC 7524]AFY46291.1 transposase [Nostoc sp. PCC 7524]AFY47868.1 transposase [Nostoc sp. PCC 7524]AFY48998.1 transposase [Nostoc sp. PCC 7524]AFY49420.1 transposase [Nostoc sp. PCC 7524]AFY49542.1 transposase [Nostoc sp. PCC 7524]
MQVVYNRCAGLDVHKKTVVACVITPKSSSGWHKEIRTFTTMTQDLLKLSDWLTSHNCTHVAMESTGEYWRPVFNILEGNFEVMLVNARHIKAVPGRKTDIKDSQWIAELLQHGLLRASFIPPVEQRDLRDLTRHRSNFIRERVNLVNRVQKVLEAANIKLASVASDVMGVSGRAMLAAIVEGSASPELMADLAKGTMRKKHDLLIQALEGRVRPHQRFILAQLLCQIDSIDETIKCFDQQIEEYCRPFDQAVELVDTIPGVARRTAEIIVSEIGTDMSRFPSAEHLAAWAGVAPGNYESGGKKLCDGTRKGNRVLRTILVQAAHALARTKTYLAAQFRRLSARRGKKRAAVAVAHSILTIAYHLISRQEPYKDLGADYFDKHRHVSVKKRLIKRLEKLGYQVSVEPVPVAI